ncbi:hypothetical protein ACQJ0H_22815, partial [Pantoea agglomerans]
MRLALHARFRHIHAETVEVRMRAAVQDPSRRSEQAFKDYPQLFQTLYARYPAVGNTVVRDGRRRMLARMGVLDDSQAAGTDWQQWLNER